MGESFDLRMPLEEAMETQRAIRRLKPDPVEDALVLRLIELALKAPTGSNAQNWEFVVVRDPAVKGRLAQRNRQAWRLYGGIGRWLARKDAKMLRLLDAVQWQADHFEEIPVLVVACLRGPACPLSAASRDELLRVDLSLCPEPAARRPGGWPRRGTHHASTVEHDLRAAHSRPTPERDTLCGRTPRLALGRYGPTTRKPVGDVVSLDRYGHRPFRATLSAALAEFSRSFKITVCEPAPSEIRRPSRNARAAARRGCDALRAARVLRHDRSGDRAAAPREHRRGPLPFRLEAGALSRGHATAVRADGRAAHGAPRLPHPAPRSMRPPVQSSSRCCGCGSRPCSSTLSARRRASMAS